MPLTLAILLAMAAAPTVEQLNGAAWTLHAAQADLARRAPASLGANRICVPGPPGWVNDGTVTIRFGVVLLSAAFQTALNETPAQNGQGATKPWVYGAMEVQTVPTPAGGVDLPPWVRVLALDEVEVIASPTWPTCQVAFFREGAPSTPWRCACRGAGPCNWTPPLGTGGFGAATSLPKNLTAPPTTWSGGGCVQKPCVEWLAETSMPEACQ